MTDELYRDEVLPFLKKTKATLLVVCLPLLGLHPRLPLSTSISVPKSSALQAVCFYSYLLLACKCLWASYAFLLSTLCILRPNRAFIF